MKKVAIQGIKSSWHDVAARDFFGEEISLLECDSFRELFDRLYRGDANHAVVAIENSIAGSILPNYALLMHYQFNIIGEVYTPIHMHLLGLPGVKFHEIEVIKSHPMAILQCSDFLWDLNNIHIEEEHDTAAVARDISKNNQQNTAAIASIHAANTYGLEVIRENIHTHKENYTRFLALSTASQTMTKTNKSTICFELLHKVGTLLGVMQVFEGFKINLTKIQSLPVLGKPYEYVFHVDFEWETTFDYNDLIRELERYVMNLKVLGTYKKGEINEYDHSGSESIESRG